MTDLNGGTGATGGAGDDPDTTQGYTLDAEGLLQAQKHASEVQFANVISSIGVTTDLATDNMAFNLAKAQINQRTNNALSLVADGIAMAKDVNQKMQDKAGY